MFEEIKIMSLILKMFKFICKWLLPAVIITCFFCGNVHADFDLQRSTEEIINTEDLKKSAPNDAVDMIGEKDAFDANIRDGTKNIFKSAVKKLTPTWRTALKQAVSLFAVAFLCGTIAPFIKQNNDCALSAVGVCGVAAIMAVSVTQTQSCVELCLDTVNSIGSFSSALLPTIASASVLSGHTVTGSMLSGVALTVTTVFIQLIKGIFAPVIYIYIAVTVANSVLDNGLMGSVASFIKGLTTGALKLGLIIYTTYSGISGAISAASDSSCIKTAKFAISGAIPVLGSAVSDATDSIMSGAAVIKNTVGVFGLLIILAICCVPFLKIAIYYLLYKICAAVSSIVTVKPICKALNGISDGFGMAMGILGTSSVLMFISIVLSILLVKPS